MVEYPAHNGFYAGSSPVQTIYIILYTLIYSIQRLGIV